MVIVFLSLNQSCHVVHSNISALTLYSWSDILQLARQYSVWSTPRSAHHKGSDRSSKPIRCHTPPEIRRFLRCTRAFD